MTVKTSEVEPVSLLAAKQALLERRLLGLRNGAAQSRIPRFPRQSPAPLSFAQQRLWFLDQVQPGNPAYNLLDAWRLHGPLNSNFLEQAFNEVLQRHEALRTTFAAVQGQPVQVVAPAQEFRLKYADLRPVSSGEREKALHKLLSEEARRPFDLTRDLLVRGTLYCLGEEEHALQVTMHHIISDAWSLGVLYNELNHLYAALAGSRLLLLPPLGVQYADFAIWQRQFLTGDNFDRHIGYWKAQLAGALTQIDLPTDKSRPAQQNFLGALEMLSLPEPLGRELKALSRREGVTLFMTLLAAFKTLLHRYTHQTDLMVGTPVHGRSQCETEDLIGFFVNTLVLRTDLSSDPPFREALQRVRQTALDAYAHQEVPFEKLVMELQPERSSSYSPLFQTMFVLQGPSTHPPQLPGVSASPIQVDNGSAKFDLSLVVMHNGDKLTAAFEYNRELFEAPRIQRMLRHFATLLQQIVENPETRLSRLGLVGEEERRQLVVGWNQTQREYAREVTWVELFERQVQRSGEATALVFGEERLKYEQLNQRVNQLAGYLRGLGVGTESLVGICAERSVEMVVAILGVLKAGGAYLPMDPGYPAERLSFMLEDARVGVVLTQGKIGRQWPGGVKVVDLDELDVSVEPRENPAVLSKPEHLAYVIYTSGSTGQPKGVAIEHRSLNAFAHWAQELYGRELEGVLAGTSICFDLSVFELLVPLCWGGKVILAHNVLELAELAARDEVRLINTVPSAAGELVRMGVIPGGVEVINLAGEPLRQSLVEQLYGLGSVKKVYDLYGPTEDTVYSTCALRQAGGRATIGRPLSNKQVYILDEQMEPVPVGVVGQLYIGGEGLARGYLHRPELTEQRFVGNRWARRVYKTGDLARYQWDGNIEFIGRADHQVKIRGFRIELGEVETQLRGHEKVREAVVVAREENGEKRLVGYVVGEGELSLSELKEHLKKRLPDYMVPSALVLLEKLPLTPNGKVDRKALPAPDPAAVQTEAFVAPESDLEQLLAGIWCEVLGLTRVGIHDNFFELGGHSLMITKLISRVRDGIQVELPMASVFEAPTIAELALLVEDLLIQEIDGLTDEEAAKLDQTVVGSR
jgi:amino acid adenylation domain-containing protein